MPRHPKRTPLMSHAERRALIERPLTFHIHHGRTSGGILIRDDVPLRGRRVVVMQPWDRDDEQNSRHSEDWAGKFS